MYFIHLVGLQIILNTEEEQRAVSLEAAPCSSYIQRIFTYH